MEIVESLENSVNPTTPAVIEPIPIQAKINTDSVAIDNTNYKEWILAAIDKLRERKARPDAEKIGILLKRYHNVSLEDTQNSLNRLADSGEVVCVDYKGNVSYRNPTKWRKSYSGGGGVLNTPSISQRILEVAHSMREEIRARNPIPDSNFTEPGSEAVVTPSPIIEPAFSFADIENALATVNVANAEKLTGNGLRTVLDRECTYGGLIKLPDGRYAIDETGVKKKPPPSKKTSKQHGSVSTTKSTTVTKAKPQKSPLPPPLQAAIVLPTDIGTICQQQLQPVYSQQSPITNLNSNTIGVSPIDYTPPLPQMTIATSFGSTNISPSFKTSGSGGNGKPNGGSGRRGRPPGSKNKKCTALGEQPPKKIKTEGVSVSQDSSQDPDYSNASTPGKCVKCGSQAVDIEDFLTCKDCSMKAHPSCLGYWAELTERARRSPWQCSDCKTCCICQDPGAPEQMLICDACDKGFHAGCHQPPVTYPMDESTAWLCQQCRLEGHRVASDIVNTPSVEPSKVEESYAHHQTAGGRGYYSSPAPARFPPREMNGDVSVSNTVQSVPNHVNNDTSQEAPNTNGGTPTPVKEEESSDPRNWSVDDVAQWLTTEGFQREARAFREQEIDGPCLLLMKRMDVLTELGIKLGPAVKIYERIKRLQNRGSWSYGEVY